MGIINQKESRCQFSGASCECNRGSAHYKPPREMVSYLGGSLLKALNLQAKEKNDSVVRVEAVELNQNKEKKEPQFS